MVFNPSHVEQNGKVYAFTCGHVPHRPSDPPVRSLLRRDEQSMGDCLRSRRKRLPVSACVIDHLWHLTESGYYHRQGGPYPPHTWKAESIVQHKHQMAAYCGIEYFDSRLPPAYRDKLYMGNIHGSCINVDRIQRAGATYEGLGEPDFVSANDVWFMPVSPKGRSRRMPLHSRLVRSIPLLSRCQRRSQRHRSRTWPALPSSLRRTPSNDSLRTSRSLTSQASFVVG